MPQRDRAAYMRHYRMRQKAVKVAARVTDLLNHSNEGSEAFAERVENKRLTEEVARLARALAQAQRDAILRKVAK